MSTDCNIIVWAYYHIYHFQSQLLDTTPQSALCQTISDPAAEWGCSSLFYQPCPGWQTRAGFAAVGRGRRGWSQPVSSLLCLVCSVAHSTNSTKNSVAASHPWMVRATYCFCERRLTLRRRFLSSSLEKNQEPELYMPGPMHLKDHLFLLMQGQEVFLEINTQLS